jgi:hypothetical protein
MKQVCEYLYYGPAPKSKTMREELDNHIQVFVNLRESSETSHWYCNDERETISFPIANGSIYQDKGRVSDKNKSVKELCHRIVEHIHAKRNVYIHCVDGVSTCGPIVLGCWFWIMNDSKFDPLHEIRQKAEFQLCKSNEQQQQLDDIKKYALSIIRWKAFSKNK